MDEQFVSAQLDDNFREMAFILITLETRKTVIPVIHDAGIGDATPHKRPESLERR